MTIKIGIINETDENERFAREIERIANIVWDGVEKRRLHIVVA